MIDRVCERLIKDNPIFLDKMIFNIYVFIKTWLLWTRIPNGPIKLPWLWTPQEAGAYLQSLVRQPTVDIRKLPLTFSLSPEQVEGRIIRITSYPELIGSDDIAIWAHAILKATKSCEPSIYTLIGYEDAHSYAVCVYTLGTTYGAVGMFGHIHLESLKEEVILRTFSIINRVPYVGCLPLGGKYGRFSR